MAVVCFVVAGEQRQLLPGAIALLQCGLSKIVEKSACRKTAVRKCRILGQKSQFGANLVAKIKFCTPCQKFAVFVWHLWLPAHGRRCRGKGKAIAAALNFSLSEFFRQRRFGASDFAYSYTFLCSEVCHLPACLSSVTFVTPLASSTKFVNATNNVTARLNPNSRPPQCNFSKNASKSVHKTFSNLGRRAEKNNIHIQKSNNFLPANVLRNYIFPLYCNIESLLLLLFSFNV